MANRKKEDEGRRIHLQLPAEAYEATSQLAAKRKQSISEFVRRAVDFQAWLETVMPDVEGFGADELAKFKLARKQLAELEQHQVELLNEDADPRDENLAEEALQTSSAGESEPIQWGPNGKTAGALSH